MAAIRYLLSIKPENFMFLAQIFMELFLIEDTNHRCPGARQLRHVLLLFTNVTLPLMYPRITGSQDKETDDSFVLTVHMSFLNILLLLCWWFRPSDTSQAISGVVS